MLIHAIMEDGRPSIRVHGCSASLNSFFSSASFDRADNSWRLPYGELNSLLSALSGMRYVYVDEVAKGVEGDDLLSHLRSQELSADYVYKTDPFPHQVEGFYYGMACPNFLLADEMGLGKSKQSIDLAVNRKARFGIRHCLIVCGVSSLRFNWKVEVSTHSDEGCHILGERAIRQGKNKGMVKLGGNREKLADVARLPELPFFVVTNVESLRDPNVLNALSGACDSGEIGMVVFDEFHRCKNPQTKQGKAILKLNPAYKVAMTGTPVLNTPLDLYTALAWLGVERHSFYAFKNFYCYMDGHTVTGYKHQDELRKSLVGHMLRRRKDEVLRLPPKIRVDEVLEMDDAQSAVYSEVLEDIRGHMVDVYLSPNPLTKMVRLRQATGFPGIISESVSQSVKLSRMREIVEDVVSNGRKCVVFTNWVQVADEAGRILSDFMPAMYTGERKDYEAEADRERFMSDPKCRVLIGTISKMGVGLTLTAATTCVFLDEPWNRGTKEQCEDRLHRIGMTEPITVVTLMCRGTIDEKVHALVYAKGEMADLIVDGKVAKDKARRTVEFLLS